MRSFLAHHESAQTNEWIFYSKNTVTGQVLRIDMERMMRALNDYFGWDFIHEWEEECQHAWVRLDFVHASAQAQRL